MSGEPMGNSAKSGGRTICAVWLAVVLLCTALPGNSAVARETAPTLSLAMSGAFQPFSTTDAEGSLVGFDADIAREIGRRLGRRPVLVQTDWAGIQAGLQSGKYDLICGSMAITPERLESMHFSLPYYVSGAQIFARPEMRELRGARIGVTEDSTYAKYISDHPGEFPNAEVVHYGSEAEIVAAMNADKIDAFVSDRIVGGFYINKGAADKIVPFGGLLYKEACGIAARLDSAALVHAVNEALFEMIQDGTYTAIYEAWVGTPPDLRTLLASWADHESYIPPLRKKTTDLPATGATFADRASAMLPLLAKGAVLTLELSLITALLALLMGSLIGVATAARSSLLRRLSSGYIWLVRGTPLLVQLFISYFVLAT
ncbi:MAG: ABC transporter permease subunit, partial [Armatimonadetes bacterium]|nr:ABC transporter permease subunit [Armatimonadota bacterium]